MSDAANASLDLNGPDPARAWGIGEVLRLSIPSVLGTVSFTVMQFVDVWMVSKVSKEAMAAQLIGGLVSLTLNCFFMGTLSCVSTFVSQNLGAGFGERAARYGWQGLWISWVAAAAQALLIPVAGPFLSLFGGHDEILALEVTYFQILVAGAALVLTTSALTSFFLGIHRPIVPLVASVAGNVVNFVAAYTLIFGKFGLPAMGLVGAGLATLIGMAVQTVILCGLFVAGPLAREFQIRRAWRPSGTALAALLRIGAPAGVVFFADILMWDFFLGRVIANFGKAHLEAAAILWRYWSLCFLPALGVGAAATAVVGRHCGARRPDLAWRRAHAALLLVEVYMVSAGIVTWIFRQTLVAQFNETGDPVVQALAADAFIFILLCQAFDAMNVIFISALRGAGDTLVPGVIQPVLAYAVGLGGSALVAWRFPQWGSFGAWSMASLYVVVLGLIMWGRFLRGKWRTMIVVEPALPPIEEGSVLPPVRA